MAAQHEERQQQEQPRHCGHEPFRRAPDSRRPAAQDQPRRERQDDAEPQPKLTRVKLRGDPLRCSGNRSRSAAYLREIADAEGGERRKQRIHQRERTEFFAQRTDIIHRPARIPHAVAPARRNRQADFRKLHGHPQQSRRPHPEHRARPAHGYGLRRADDVAGAEGGSQRGGCRLHGAYAVTAAALRELAQ